MTGIITEGVRAGFVPDRLETVDDLVELILARHDDGNIEAVLRRQAGHGGRVEVLYPTAGWEERRDVVTSISELSRPARVTGVTCSSLRVTP